MSEDAPVKSSPDSLSYSDSERKEMIPAYLRIPQAERDAAWKGRKLTQQGANFAAPRRDEEPATKKLRAQLEAEVALKKAERLAELKRWKEEHRK